MRNSVFWGNEAEAGGAVYARGRASTLGRYVPELVLQNCTFYANGAGTALDAVDAGFLGQNLVVWGQPGLPAVRIEASDAYATAVTYSDIQGGFTGTGNVDVDPGFVDPAAGDLRLRGDSPLVDAGTAEPALFPPGPNMQPGFPVPASDRDGNPRPCGAGIDMGAYEACE